MIMLGSSMLNYSYAILLTVFSIKCLSNFLSHLLICSTWIPHAEEPNLCIFSLKSLCKDGIINNIKYKDVCRHNKVTLSLEIQC